MTNIDWLLKPTLYSRQEMIYDTCPAPGEFGVYACFFKDIPDEIPIEGCHQVDGWTLLYLGVSPMKSTDTNFHKNNLKKRLRTHLMNDAEGSTLRKSLGVLLAKKTGYSLRLIKPEKQVDKNQRGKKKRVTLTNSGEQALDRWLDHNIRVTWLVHSTPWDIIPELFSQFTLPLSLDSPNKIPFHAHLSKWRSQAKKKAKSLPEVKEKASER